MFTVKKVAKVQLLTSDLKSKKRELSSVRYQSGLPVLGTLCAEQITQDKCFC